MSIYEEVEIEDMKFDAATLMYSYPCPCGDRFAISLDELLDGDDVATCPSCTLRIRVIYDIDSLPNPDDLLANTETAVEKGESKDTAADSTDSKETKDSKEAKDSALAEGASSSLEKKDNADSSLEDLSLDKLQITNNSNDSKTSGI